MWPGVRTHELTNLREEPEAAYLLKAPAQPLDRQRQENYQIAKQKGHHQGARDSHPQKSYHSLSKCNLTAHFIGFFISLNNTHFVVPLSEHGEGYWSDL